MNSTEKSCKWLKLCGSKLSLALAGQEQGKGNVNSS